MAGGETTTRYNDADFCVLSKHIKQDTQEKVVHVTEEWIFESLSNFKKQDPKKFQLEDEKIPEKLENSPKKKAKGKGKPGKLDKEVSKEKEEE
jgi:hypothetical protein